MEANVESRSTHRYLRQPTTSTSMDLIQETSTKPVGAIDYFRNTERTNSDSQLDQDYNLNKISEQYNGDSSDDDVPGEDIDTGFFI